VRRRPFTDPEHLPAAAAEVADIMARGGVVLLPTESFYGLGADPDSSAAVARIFAAKDRPRGRPLPVVCSDWQQVDSLVAMPDRHRVRLGRIWPAALTVVAASRRPLAAGPGGTLAVRIPGHALLRALLYRVGPLTATSANRHQAPPCTCADEAIASLVAAPDLVLDAGELSGGEVSTMVDLTGEEATVLRRGPVAWDQIFDPVSEEVRDL
jgi:L-threonylcarbamoyladenylate synthase